MTAIKVSQLPVDVVLSVGDALIVNNIDVSPVTTSQTTIGNLLTFAETQLVIPATQVTIGTSVAGVQGRPDLGPAFRARNFSSTGLLASNGVTTQEEFNTWSTANFVQIDNEIQNIVVNGSGVTNITGGAGIQTNPIGGITSTGTISVDATVMLTDIDQVVSGRKTFTQPIITTALLNAQAGISVLGNATVSENLNVAKTVTAQAFIGDGSQITNLPAGDGTVTSVTAGDGIDSTQNPLTTSGTLSVDNTVVRTAGAQTIGGQKVFTDNTQISADLTVAGNETVTGRVTALEFYGDGSNLSGTGGDGTVTSITPGEGLREGAATGSPNSNNITASGTISVDDTVVRTTGQQTLGGPVLVNGNITIPLGAGVFQGDGSGLSNISAVAGPFTFQGQVDLIAGTPPASPADGYIYFNTVSGTVNNNWPGIEGKTTSIDQMVVYSSTTNGWFLGSALDRGQYVATDGGTIQGSLTVQQALTVGGNVAITGTTTATGRITASAGVTGNVTGNLTGNATTATTANTAGTATTANNVNASRGTSNANSFLTFVPGTAGSQAVETDTNLYYNPVTAVANIPSITGTTINVSGQITAGNGVTLTGGSFVGNLIGTASNAATAANATTAQTATNADNVEINLDTSDKNYSVAFVDTVASYEEVRYNTQLKYNPSTDTLTAQKITSTDVTTTNATVSNTLTVNNVTGLLSITAANATIATLNSTDATLTNIVSNGQITATDADFSGTLNVTGTGSNAFITDLTAVAITTQFLGTNGILSQGDITIVGNNPTTGQPYKFIGDGSGLFNLPGSEADGTVQSVVAGTGLAAVDSEGNPVGAITTTGTLSVDNSVITTTGGQSIDGTTTVKDLTVTEDIVVTSGGSITCTGNIEVTGQDGQGNPYKFIGDGSGLVGVTSDSGGTVQHVRAEEGGGIATSPATTYANGVASGGITVDGLISVDNTVMRLTNTPQTVQGSTTFSNGNNFFQGNVSVSGTLSATALSGDGSNITGVVKSAVTQVTGGTGIITNPSTSSPGVGGIVATGSVAIDPTVVTLNSNINQTVDGTKTFSKETQFNSGVDITGSVIIKSPDANNVTVGGTQVTYIGDGSQLSGIKAGMFTFCGNTSVTGTAPTITPDGRALVPGDVFQNTTAGTATSSWVGIDGQFVAANQLVIYGLGGDGVNAWVRGAIADTGQFLSTQGGTVLGATTFDSTVTVGGVLTASAGVSGNASSATDCSREVVAGNGLTGGGELNSDVTLTVQAADSSITVGTTGIAVNPANIKAGDADKADLATVAQKVLVNSDNADIAKFLLFAQGTGATGQTVNSTTGVQVNPSNDKLTAAGFIGSGAELTGVTLLEGDQVINGGKTFGSSVACSEATENGDDDGILTTKGYVDAKIAGTAGGVTDIAIPANSGLVATKDGAGINNITQTATLNVDTTRVMMLTGDQITGGVKTFNNDIIALEDILVTGDVDITGSGKFKGDGSGLTGVTIPGMGTVTEVSVGTGLTLNGTTSTDITTTGTIEIDSSVLTTSGGQTIQNAAFTVNNGNIICSGTGKFIGDGSLLSGLPQAAGPFNFEGSIDPVASDPPSPVADGDVYFSTAAGLVKNSWPGIGGEAVVIDQLIVYSSVHSRWYLGNALDRGQYVPTSGGGFTGALTVDGSVTVTGSNDLSVSGNGSVTGTLFTGGLLTSNGGFKCGASSTFTGNLTGNVTGNVVADTVTASGNISATGKFIGPLQGNADTATAAATVTVSANSTNQNYSLLFSSATGNNPLYSTTSLTYNPSTGKVTAPGAVEVIGTLAATALEGDGSGVNNVDALTCQKSVITGNGLSGGGDLSQNRTLSVDAGNGLMFNGTTTALQVKAGTGITVDANGVSVNQDALHATVAISETAPGSPAAGDLWWKSSTGIMYIYYTDADGSQWVAATHDVTSQQTQITNLQNQISALLVRVAALES